MYCNFLAFILIKGERGRAYHDKATGGGVGQMLTLADKG